MFSVIDSQLLLPLRVRYDYVRFLKILINTHNLNGFRRSQDHSNHTFSSLLCVLLTFTERKREACLRSDS